MKKKIDVLLEYLKQKKEITAREVCSSPFYYNCPHSAIRDLKKFRGVEFTTEWKEVKNNQGVKTRFQTYRLEGV